MNSTTMEAKALAAFAKQAPKGERKIIDQDQHIDYAMQIHTETGSQINIAVIIVKQQGLTLANLATLQAYKSRNYNYSYILAYNETDIYYCEISQVAGHVDQGTFKLNKDCMKKAAI